MLLFSLIISEILNNFNNIAEDFLCNLNIKIKLNYKKALYRANEQKCMNETN